jgi:hypothetical protein
MAARRSLPRRTGPAPRQNRTQTGLLVYNMPSQPELLDSESEAEDREEQLKEYDYVGVPSPFSA